MLVRCTTCNSALQIQRGTFKSLDKCGCGGRFKIMHGKMYPGEPPLAGTGFNLLGKLFFQIYIDKSGAYLYHKATGKFVKHPIENPPGRFLQEDEKRKIKAYFLQTGASDIEIAAHFNVSQQCISKLTRVALNEYKKSITNIKT